MDPNQPYYQFGNTGSSSGPVRYLEEFDDTQWEEPSFGFGEEDTLQTFQNGGRDIYPNERYPPSHHTWPYLPNQGYDQYPESQRYNQFQTYPQGPPGPTLPWVHGTLACLNCESPPGHNALRCQRCTFFNRDSSPEEEKRHCMKCMAPIKAPNLLCPTHYGRQYLTEAERDHLNQDGVCGKCLSREKGSDETQCSRCKYPAAVHAEGRHRREQSRLERGYCQRCGRNPLDNDSSKTCSECLSKDWLGRQRRARNY